MLRLHHVGVLARDVDRSVRFYVEAFGCTPYLEWQVALGTSGQDFPGRGVMLISGDQTRMEIFPALNEGEPPYYPPRGVNHFCFAVADCDAAYARALRAGGSAYRVRRGPVDWDGRPTDMQIGDGVTAQIRIAYLSGPDGEVIELLQEFGP